MILRLPAVSSSLSTVLLGLLAVACPAQVDVGADDVADAGSAVAADVGAEDVTDDEGSDGEGSDGEGSDGEGSDGEGIGDNEEVAPDDDRDEPAPEEPSAPAPEEPSTPAPEEPSEPAAQDPAPFEPAASAPAAGATALVSEYRVLHWNIAGGKENGCRTDNGIVRAVRRYVVEHDVDFVGLNEVCPQQYEAIKDSLRQLWGKGRGAVFSAYVGDEGGGPGNGRTVGNAIYSRKNLTGITRELLGSDQYGNRNLLCGRVASLPHLRFCSTHLTPGDSTARRQLVRAMDRVEQWWEGNRDTVLLSGDLNLTPADAGLNAVYAAAANTRNNPDNRGRYREVDDDDANHCRGYGERSHAGSGGPCGEGGKIDFILARANRIVDGDYAGDSLAIPTDCSGVCSDHRAIFGRAKLRVRLD